MPLQVIVKNFLRQWETGHFIRTLPPALGAILFVITEPFLASSFFSTVNIGGALLFPDASFFPPECRKSHERMRLGLWVRRAS